METNILNKLSKTMQIAPEFVVREYWEMVILDELGRSNFKNQLIFKGGTSLRLGYNSPRFSEDLDFDLNKKLLFAEFEKTINKIIEKYPELSLKDLAEKYNTLLAQISIKEENLARAFSIKIEISKRYIRDKKYSSPKLLVSPMTSKQVLLNTAKLENIKKEKLNALGTRKQPRDLFDLWYIAQLKREVWQCPKHSFTELELKKELSKFLPNNYLKIIDELVFNKK
ncbi:MAG: nucleotidyl transferase AbiEii/AbiGii toxin family protein [Patescibacteria group bacterium]